MSDEIITLNQPAPENAKWANKKDFQERFPKMPDGISTKWDAMDLFLKSDSYASSIGVTGAAMHALRLLINKGVNRLTASIYVDMAPNGAAAGMTLLLTQPSIPAEFRLSAAERDAIMLPPLTEAETYKGTSV